MDTITEGKYWQFFIEEPKKINEKMMDYLVYDSKSGKKIKLNRMSGGTQDQILLTLRLAFGISLLTQAGGTAPKFLVLDECFGSSDTERREKIVDLIRNKMSQYYKQIIVITHEEDVIRNIPHYIHMQNGKIKEKVVP
jgi:DNA repair exonuclease SbcCD ATPase subunit